MKEKYHIVAKTITRWKLDNWLENQLGYLADKNEFWKKIYVLYYRIFDNKYYQCGLKFIEKEIEKQLPNLEKGSNHILTRKYLRRDMIYSLHRFGTSFEEYFIFKFYDKNYIGRSRFNNLKLQYGFCEIVNHESVRELFEDKGACYKVLKEYYKRDVVVVYGKDEFKFLEDFINKHKSFIYKPLKGHSGIGIKIYHDWCADATTFYNNVLKQGAFVVEELIEQAPTMAALHKESINTIRLATFKIGTEIVILGAAIRMGTGNSSVDNAGSGGIYASVDMKYGIVNSIARDNKNNQYTIHPDTNCKIVGFEIPEWQEAISLVKVMAKTVEGATMIAWDLAYSSKGWLVIEGNDVGEAYLLQAQYQVGLKHQITSLIDKFLIENNK